MKKIIVSFSLMVIGVMGNAQQPDNIPWLNLNNVNYPVIRDSIEKKDYLTIPEGVKTRIDSYLKLKYRVKLTDNPDCYDVPTLLNGLAFFSYSPICAYDVETGEKIPFGGSAIKERLKGIDPVHFHHSTDDGGKLVDVKTTKLFDVVVSPKKTIYTESAYVDWAGMLGDSLKAFSLSDHRELWKIPKDLYIIIAFNSKYLIMYNKSLEGDKWYEVFDVWTCKILFRINFKGLKYTSLELEGKMFYYTTYVNDRYSIYAIDLDKQKVAWRLDNLESSIMGVKGDSLYLSNLRIVDIKSGNFIFKDDNAVGIVSILGKTWLVAAGAGDDNPYYYIYNPQKKILVAQFWDELESNYQQCGEKSWGSVPKVLFPQRNMMVGTMTCDDGVYLYGFKIMDP